MAEPPIPAASQIGLQWCAFDSLVGRIIDWGTQGSVGHVDLILPQRHRYEGELLGAQHEEGLGGMPSGVQIRPADYVQGAGGFRIVRAILQVTQAQADSLYEWALSMLGTPYDTQAIEGIAVGADWSSAGKLICSGFVAGALTQADNPIFPHKLLKHWRIISPEEVLLMCNVLTLPVPLDWH